MIAEALLACALALPPISFHEPESINAWIEQYHELKKFIHRIHPGAEILITRIGNAPKDPHWEQLPFIWKNQSVWIKRHHIYDHIRASA